MEDFRWLNCYKQIFLLAGIITFFLTSAFVLSMGYESANYQVYIVPPIANEKVLPRSPSIKGVLADTLSIFATPGEYEPAGFAINAREELKEVDDRDREEKSYGESNSKT